VNKFSIKEMMMNLRSVTLIAFALALVPAMAAQETMAVASAGPVKHLELNVRAEGRVGVEPVKGVPFCATVTSDHTQVFADGNRIHTTDSSLVCRDSQGRIRREAQLNLLGAVPQGTTPKMITIEDPVAGVRYILDPFAKVAQKMALLPPPPPGKEGGNVVFYAKTGQIEGPAELPPPPPATVGGPVMVTQRVLIKGAPGGDENPPTSENLGDQTINGMEATGTRLTTTIPAGKMGNEEPINVVSENWYSPELKATIMTKHSDPWSGQITTQFTNVNTSEPDPSLFTVPSDYKVVDEKSGPVMIHLQAPPPQQ
jgi:hypothetical protein